MGKQWDGGDIAFRPEVWRQALRVLKPGGHLLAFGSSRGYGRMQVAIEDAGFETRDCILEMIDTDPRVAAFVNSLNDAQRCAFLQIVVESSDVGGLMAWMFGTGFPKSHNVALDFEKTIVRRARSRKDGRTVWRYKSDGELMARARRSGISARKIRRPRHRAQTGLRADRDGAQAADRQRGRELRGVGHGFAQYRCGADRDVKAPRRGFGRADRGAITRPIG
jgi:hypothetical protein